MKITDRIINKYGKQKIKVISSIYRVLLIGYTVFYLLLLFNSNNYYLVIFSSFLTYGILIIHFLDSSLLKNSKIISLFRGVRIVEKQDLNKTQEKTLVYQEIKVNFGIIKAFYFPEFRSGREIMFEDSEISVKENYVWFFDLVTIKNDSKK